MASAVETAGAITFWVVQESDGGFRYAEIPGERCVGALGRRPEEFIDPEEAARLSSFYRRCVESRSVTTYERPVQYASGERWYRTTLVPLGEFDGAERIRATLVDVTEMRRAERRLAQTEEALQHAERLAAIGRLASGLAHDLNNQLTIVAGHAELLDAGGGFGNASRVELISAVDRGGALTKRLLALSRPRRRQPGSTDPNQVVDELSQVLSRLFSADVELRVSLQAESCALAMDRFDLEQVLLNLCINARDAMPEGGLLTLRTHRIEPGRKPPAVVIEVADTGSGMTPEVRDRIFEPFFTTKGDEGTGLGLSSVREMVIAAGGRLACDSSAGLGTTFRIELPLEPS